jgi:hypothetical protein
MIRELVIATAAAAAAVALAPPAAADPSSANPADAPGMNYEANLAGPCDNYQVFTFGRGPGGETLACHWIPNQWPPVYTGFWVASYPLYGQQDIGAPCPGPKSAAQAPDGRPMVCLGAKGWQPGTLTGAGFFPG